MTESERDTSKPLLDDDEAPTWSDEVFARAEIREGDRVIRPATGTLTRRGRPKSERPKRQVTLRLDLDVLEHFRAGGPGWQSRMNEVLRKAIGAS
jgi:uncharacterized protein (DUF4415 family)